MFSINIFEKNQFYEHKKKSKTPKVKYKSGKNK